MNLSVCFFWFDENLSKENGKTEMTMTLWITEQKIKEELVSKEEVSKRKDKKRY